MSTKQQTKLSAWFTKKSEDSNVSESTKSSDVSQSEDDFDTSAMTEDSSSLNSDIEVCATISSIASAPMSQNIAGSSSLSNRSDSRKIDPLDVSKLNEPNQPVSYKFPKQTEKGRNFGRSFQASWFKEYSWLHYHEAHGEEKDAAFCFICLKAIESGSLSEQSLKQSDAFTKSGFNNWKSAMEKSSEKGSEKKKKSKGFQAHQDSGAHKEAVERYVSTKPYENNSIVDQLNTRSQLERRNNRRALLKILSNTKYLSRQSSAFRGNWNTDTGTEENSNYHQLLRLRGEDDPYLLEWIKRKDDKFTSPPIQNEMINNLAEEVLRDITTKMKNATFFSIMADESADICNQEQVVVCIRWVGNDLTVQEDFLSLKPVARCTAEGIVQVLMETLKELGLKMEDCRGQCYDGASVMSGAKSGVAQGNKLVNNKCLYTHCYGHALNLCVKDGCEKVPCLKSCLETSKDLCNLVKKSPQRETMLKKLRLDSKNADKSLHAFCPTGWTVRESVLNAVIRNHSELMDLWEDSLKITKDFEMRGRILGAQAQMKTFPYMFGCHLGQKILTQTDNLSKALQNPDLSAVEAQQLATSVLEILKKDRCEERFKLFWDLTKQIFQDLEIEEPELKRKRKKPKRFEDGAEAHEFSSPEDHYRVIYFEAYDVIMNAIKERFNQADFKMYATMQNILLKSVRGEKFEDEINKDVLSVGGREQSFATLYKDDVDMELLTPQLALMPKLCRDVSSVTISNIIESIRKVSQAKRTIISEVVTIIKLLLVAPATNAESERIFSAMKRLKTYLRSTMKEKRLSGLMLLSVHKDITDNLDLIEVANKFVRKNDSRRHIFGIFTKTDEQQQSFPTTCNISTQTLWTLCFVLSHDK